MSELDLSSNGVSKLPDSFFEAISAMNDLTELLLQHNAIDSADARRLFEAIPSPSQLHQVWLQNNQINDETARAAINQLLATRGLAQQVKVIFGN